jgi:hypothetical protein
MDRYFIFIYPENGRVKDFLNLAIFLLNPEEKWQAHITVAGPYSSTRNLPRNLEFVQKISLLGVGQFRSERQNTVFIEAGSKDLRSFWDKPDYPYKPHLTLYDGEDFELADALYLVLRDIRMFLKFFIKQVHVVKSVKGQGSLDLAQNANPNILTSIRDFTIEDLKGLPSQTRLFYAIEALKRAKYESRLI